MSSPTPTPTPLHRPVKAGVKKRRRSFRPSNRTSRRRNSGVQGGELNELSGSQGQQDESFMGEDQVEVKPIQKETMHQSENEDATACEQQTTRLRSHSTGASSSKPGKIVAIGSSRPVTTAPLPTTSVKEDAASTLPDNSVKSGRKHVVLQLPTHRSPPIRKISPHTGTQPVSADGLSLATICSGLKGHRKSARSSEAKNSDKSTIKMEGDILEATAGPIVQIVDGEIVLQESSMVVNGSVTRAEDDCSVVEEEAQLAVVGASYNSFIERRKPTRWTIPETEKFFGALRVFGTDFGTMEAFFKNTRTRKQLKRKYQVELTKNPQLVEKALHPKFQKDMDIAVFETNYGKKAH